jgi:hypothetical protein
MSTPDSIVISIFFGYSIICFLGSIYAGFEHRRVDSCMCALGSAVCFFVACLKLLININ